MQIAFAIIAALTLVSAIGAMCFRNLVHCALSLAITFAGLAAIYLQLGAPFLGWAQVLVYIGAVAILIVFAILLTRSDAATPHTVLSPSWIIGLCVAVLVFGVLARAILTSSLADREPAEDSAAKVAEAVKVRQIGSQLMTRYVLPLEAAGLLLTAATIGAVIIAMPEKLKKPSAKVSAARMEPAVKQLETQAH